MKKKIKKVIIVLLVLLVLAGVAFGGLYAYRIYQKENLQAEVVLVSNLNWGYSSNAITSAGYVRNDYSQYVYTEDKTVAEVKVQEGAEVKIGDALLVYDTTETQLEIDMKKMELQGIKNDIKLAKRELEELNKINPIADSTSSSSSSSSSKSDTDSSGKQTSTQSTAKKEPTVVMMQVERKDGDAYNFIDKKAKPYTGKGTADDPYRFLCTQECYVMGSYLNQLMNKEKVAAFEIWSGNSVEDGTLLSCWTVDGAQLSAVEENSKWSVTTHQRLDDEVIIEEETETEIKTEEPESEEPESTEEVYTAAELREEKQSIESELKDLDIDRRTVKVEIEKLKKKRKEATVVATIDGVVKSVADPQNPPTDGSPFIEIANSSGVSVKGEISELMLDQIKIGQEVTANSWSNGQTYDGKITEISEYPTENSGGYYGEGNPNVSYYSFTAYIENADGLLDGDYVDLSITSETDEEELDSIFIEKAYVREEDGKSYVLKAGEDERLVKQYVQTGRTLYGSAVEIKAGLSGEDRIAFPYGKTAKEGIKAIDSDAMD